MRAPMMDIHTVAAGGGSVLHFDGARYRVGPDSAGAVPGPACYRRGGPLTVTDANVMLGRVQPEHFPAVFGPGGDQPLDAEAVRRGFTALAAEITAATGDRRSPEDVAAGFLEIAVLNMANAVKKISVQRGHDITRYALTAFGGAARRFVPATSTDPVAVALIGRRPAMLMAVRDFPAPDSPTRPRRSPSPSSIRSIATISWVPIRTLKSETVSIRMLPPSHAVGDRARHVSHPQGG
jgi:5-oxoprolinase (ATP-hydrolysing)